MPENDYQLGRIEGKVDTILQMLGQHGSRLEVVEKTQRDDGNRITALETRGGTGRQWLATLVSIVAVAISALTAASRFMP